MGERIQHIAGIVMALAFIALLAMMNSSVLSIGTSVNDRLNRTSGMTEMHELQAFNDTRVTGTTVISAIKNYDNLYNYDMEIYVDGNPYGAADGAKNYSWAATHINPTASFEAKLNVNANGVTSGITFTTVP